jgi:hypothetical protein
MDNISSHHNNCNNNKEARILPPKTNRDLFSLKEEQHQKKRQGKNTSTSFTISL